MSQSKEFTFIARTFKYVYSSLDARRTATIMKCSIVFQLCQELGKVLNQDYKRFVLQQTKISTTFNLYAMSWHDVLVVKEICFRMENNSVSGWRGDTNFPSDTIPIQLFTLLALI